MKGLRGVVWIAGIIALLWAGYYFFIVMPARKDCLDRAQRAYEQAGTNYQEGLINSSTYQQASDLLQTEIAGCYH